MSIDNIDSNSMSRAKEVLKRKIVSHTRSRLIPTVEEAKVKSAAPISMGAIRNVLSKLKPGRATAGAAAGAAGVGVPAAAWYSQQAPADPDAINPATGKPNVNNLDKLVGNLSVRHALWKIKNSPDVEVDSGLDRVVIPKDRLKEKVLKYLDFVPTPIAVPERGQDKLTTWRQFDTAGHLHSHGKDWLMHQDKYPALNMVLKNPRYKGGFMNAMRQGMKHVGLEGVQGYLGFLKNVATGVPTMKQIAAANDDPDKYPKVVKYLKEKEQNALAEMGKSGSAGYEEISIKVGESTLTVQIADDDSKRRLGLGGREKLAEDSGMLFSPAGSYWMKDCNFDLDIMFIDKEAQVIDIQTMDHTQPTKNYASRTEEQPIIAIEAPAGWCERNGVRIGHKVI